MAFERTDAGVRWRGGGEHVLIEAWGDGVRVRATRRSEFRELPHALLDRAEVTGDASADAADPPPVELEISDDGAVATLRVPRLTVVATEDDYNDWSTGFFVTRLRLSFRDALGAVLFEEIGDGGALKLRAREYRLTEFGGGPLRARFSAPVDEHLVGMGVYQQALIDLKGSTLELAHRNSQTSVPFVVSSAGYGFLWNNPAVGRAIFATNVTEWSAESSPQLDYWVTAGAPPQIAAAYADATGRAPLMPENVLGFWQCKLRYWNQEQLLEAAREHRRRGIPIDVIVADFFHWPKMGDWRFEEEFWPDPQAMLDELRELGIELVVSVWPQVSSLSENFAELQQDDLLVKTGRGVDVQFSFVEESARFIDVTNPRARDWLWAKLQQSYGRYGIRLFWLDEAEPEYGAYEFDHYHYAAGPNAEIGNIYPREYVRIVADGRRAEGEQPSVSLVRAAWAGSQRHGALVWSGDVHSTFADLEAQVVAGVHLGAAGIPWFTTDIGGFSGGDPRDPAFHELLVRWFQFGVFSPVMRLHGDRVPGSPVTTSAGEQRLGTGADNEVWSFGPEVEAMLVPLIRLRESLRPYLRRVMAAAHEIGAPVMRGLFYEFPDDPVAWTVADQYLFGPDVLVAPVVSAGARARSVYLPAGADWTDVRTGVRYLGGTTVEAAAPLAALPVFVRDETLLSLFVELKELAS